MSINVYKTGYTVTVDPTLHDQGSTDEKIFRPAIDLEHRFEGDLCLIKHIGSKPDKQRYIYNDYWWNMTDSQGYLIGTKQQVDTYLLSFLGDPADTDSTDAMFLRPLLSSATVELLALSDVVMVFDAVITGSNLGFTIGGTTSSIFSSISGWGTNTITGVLSDPVLLGEVLTLSYDSTIGDIQGPEGGLVDAFENTPITNNAT